MSIQGAKVVAFGDSLTQGSVIPEGSESWTNILEKRFNLQLINSGIGGNTSSQGLERLDRDVLSHKPKFVIINFGMNDHVMEEKNKPKVDINLFKKNILQMVNRIKENGAIPILVTTNYIIEGNELQYYYSRHNQEYYIDVDGAQVWLDKYIDVVRTVGSDTKVDVIDIRKVCDKYDRYDFLRTLKNDTTDDGVHLHTLGSLIYAETIGNYLANTYGQ
jgi:lysophospholipase L1-like esterase